MKVCIELKIKVTLRKSQINGLAKILCKALEIILHQQANYSTFPKFSMESLFIGPAMVVFKAQERILHQQANYRTFLKLSM